MSIMSPMPGILDQMCPWCRAVPGQRCVTPVGRGCNPHKARYQHRADLVRHRCPFVVELPDGSQVTAVAQTLTDTEVEIIDITDAGFATVGYQPRTAVRFVCWDFE